MLASPWPVAVVAAGPVSVGTTLWRWKGQLRVTVIAKATFAFVPGADMVRAAPVELRREEVHHRGDPRWSIRAAIDLAPRMKRADVTFTGHAYAVDGEPAPKVGVRLAIERPDGTLALDKRLEILGDRSAPKGEPPPDPKPFSRMPIVYERALGGIGHAENPVGTGLNAASSGLLVHPNVLAVSAGGAEPAGLDAISRFWPARKRLLGSVHRKVLDQRIGEVPEDLDWSYFQAAPKDQRIDPLRGDEWILLENLHQTEARLRTRLPNVVGVARVYTPDGELPLRLTADTLAIDGDAERCSLVWRGSFPVPSEEILAELTVAAGTELPGIPASWPDRGSFGSTHSLVVPDAKGNSLEKTLTLDDSDFVKEEIAVDASIQQLGRSGTLVLEPSRMEPVRGGFPTGTMPGDVDPRSLQAPFPVARSGAPPAQPPPSRIPGAPWAKAEESTIAHPPKSFEGTLDIDEIADADTEFSDD